ncbi:MAG: hypothetical protein ACREI7_00875 [Myxococcota bacterium]
MIEAFAILLVAAGVVLAVGWAVVDRPHKGAGFAAALIAVLGGALLLLRGPIVELAVDDVRTLDAVAERASEDAQVIADLREQLEKHAAQIATNAAEAKRLAAEIRSELAQSEQRVAKLEELDRRRDALQSLERTAAAVEAPSGSPDQSDVPGLSARQAEVLATSLRASGTHELTLTTLSNDAEALEFAQRLKTAIEAGGWTVHGVNEAASERTVVGLEVRAPNPLPAHFATLLGALGRAGLQPKGLSRQQVDKLEVLVGSVPGKS